MRALLLALSILWFLWPALFAVAAYAALSRVARWLLGIYAVLCAITMYGSKLFVFWVRANGCLDELLDIHCSIGRFSSDALDMASTTFYAFLIYLFFATPLVVLIAVVMEWLARHALRAKARSGKAAP
jgi:hypothetical protein